MDIERTGNISITESIDYEIAQVCLAPVLGIPTRSEDIRAFAVFALVRKGDGLWEKRFAIEGLSPQEMELFRKVMNDESLA